MNIEIANQLLKLRKEKGLSQEQLAHELGISRQAVSKWERAEASPDTDNLIELARLYGISLDDLLLHEPDEKSEKVEPENDDTNKENEKYVHVGFNGIHVKEENGDEVHVSWNGIHVIEKEGDKVDIDSNGIFVNGEAHGNEFQYNKKYDFPFGVLIFVGYLIYAVLTGFWHPAWIILLSIPLFDSLVSAIRKRKLSRFAYPLLTFMVFLAVGFTYDIWHPTWVIFLTIPCFYMIAHYLEKRKTS